MAHTHRHRKWLVIRKKTEAVVGMHGYAITLGSMLAVLSHHWVLMLLINNWVKVNGVGHCLSVSATMSPKLIIIGRYMLLLCLVKGAQPMFFLACSWDTGCLGA